MLLFMLFAFAGVLLLGAPAAHANPAVAFADDQPLIVDLTGSPDSATVLVVNSSTSGATVDVTLSFAGPAARYLSRVGDQPMRVPPGPASITMKVSVDAIASVGTLILTADDGSVDREPVHLVGASPAARESPGTLVPGTFDALIVHATSFVPSFFRPLPSAKTWGWWGVGMLGGFALSFVFHRAFRDTLPAFVTATIAVVVIGAAIASLVFVGGWAASFINDKHGDAVAARTWTVTPPAPGRIGADLVGDNGRIGSLVVDGGTLTISDVPSAGNYSGTVDTQPASDTGAVKATVTVRDWWLYAFAAVLIGVLLGFVISRFYVRRPTEQFKADAADAAATIAHHESDWRAKSVTRNWGDAYAFADFAQSTVTKIRSSASSDLAGATDALATLNDLDDAMEGLRAQVALLGDQREALCARYAKLVTNEPALIGSGWLAPLDQVLSLTGRTLKQAQDVVDERLKLVPGIQAAASRAVQLAARLDAQVPRLAKLSGKAQDSLHLTWVALVEAVLTAADEGALNPFADQIDTLEHDISTALRADQDLRAEQDLTAQAYSGRRSQLLELFYGYARERAAVPAEQAPAPAAAAPLKLPGPPGSTNRDTLINVSVTATALAVGTNVHWEFSDGSSSATFPAPVPEADGTTILSISHCFASGPALAYANVIDGDGRPASAPWVESVGSFSAASRLRAALGADDRIVAMVSAVLAVASGMAALYLNSATWGSAGDYIAALLWGSATSEGVKLIVNVAGKRWPITV